MLGEFVQVLPLVRHVVQLHLWGSAALSKGGGKWGPAEQIQPRVPQLHELYMAGQL